MATMVRRLLERGDLFENRYRIVYFLGSGASAQVYLARDLKLDRDVAIKVLHEFVAADTRFLRRFRAEAKAVAALDHRHIVKLYDYNESAANGLPYITMEYLGGGSLRSVLDHGPLTVAQVIGIGIAAASALDHAGRRGIVHRDIKPANLLFGLDRQLKIADFGVARALSESSVTDLAGSPGTPKYVAPEQVQGSLVSPAADVYALALVLAEAVSGEAVFERDTPDATSLARLGHDLSAPAEAGPLGPLLEAAGKLDPEERISAVDLQLALIELSRQFARPADIPIASAVPPSELDAVAADVAAEVAAIDLTAVLEVEDPTEVLSAVGATGAPALGEPVSGEPASGDSDPDTDIATPATVRLFDAAAIDDTALDTAALDTAAVEEIAIGADATSPPDESVDVAAGEAAGESAATGALDAGPDADSDAPPVDPSNERSPRRWPWIVVSVVLVIGLIAGGTYWWIELRIPRHPVLNVVGEVEQNASQALKDLGFEVEVTRTRQDDTDPNEVIAQDPAAGEELREGETVHLTVSLGNSLVPYPALEPGVSDEGSVLAALDEVGLVVGQRDDPFDETVPAGVLISATPQVAPDATGQVPKSTPVDLVISAGPAPRKVPVGLVGQSAEAASQILASVQLGMNRIDEFSDQPVGTVVRLGQPENTELPRDSAVDVVVSIGPETFPIPDVRGQSGTQAEATLNAAGFSIAGIDGAPSAAVVGQRPQPGELHVKGTAVQLLTSRA